MKAPVTLDRRTLLIGGGVGVGLVVALATKPWLSGPARSGNQSFGAYLKIGPDGRLIVAVPQVETGQGVWTALPQIVAEEIGAAWDMVAVEPAPFGDGFANSFASDEGWFAGLGHLRRFRLDDAAGRMTARSTSIRAFGQPLREAGAAARHMLIRAAAERWDVAPEQCDTADSHVVHRGERLGFAELAESAAQYSPPSNPALRKARAVGGALPRLDLPAKSDGSFRFAADVRLPDMLFASARLAPPGGKLRSPKAGGKVILGDNWVAAHGPTTWAAEQSLKAADVQFDVPLEPVPITTAMDDALATGEAERWFTRGDYEATVEGSRSLTALYSIAATMHLGLEPLSATARIVGGAVEVWAATQAPELARGAANRGTGSAVTFYPMPPGDGAGRAMEPDLISIAIALATKLKRPVQVSLSPSASQNHDRPAPPALARMYGLLGTGGIPAAWKMRLVTAGSLGSSLSRLAGGDDLVPLSSPPGGGAPPYAIPNVRIDAVPFDLPFRAGYMRGSPEREIAFFTESFVDELARAAGLEPLSFRMAMLGGNPRLAACLQHVAGISGWDGGARGSTLGMAACSAYGSHIALVAQAAIGSDQRIEVQRLLAVVDCGRVVNPELVRQQIGSGMLWALGQATVPVAQFVGPTPVARAFANLGLPTIGKVPDIRVDIIGNGRAPGGISGLGIAVVAPAVANAIYAGTGRRLRSLPFDPMAA